MKNSIAVVLLAAAMVSAQNATVSGGLRSGSARSSTASYSTVTYDECSNAAGETYTSTGTITKTYCPECTMAATALNNNAVHTTVYTTVYSQFCPTAPSYFTPVTYTVTESCTGATPTFITTPHVPQAFTTTNAVCTVCGKTPITAIITYPIAVAPTVVPAQTSAAIIAPTTPVATTHTLAAVTETFAAMTAPTTAMAVAQVSCPGPDCKAPETSGPLTTMPAANWGNTTNITPFTGGASSISPGQTALAVLFGIVVLRFWAL